MSPPDPRELHERFTRIFRAHAKAAYRTVICCGIPASDAEDCVTRVFEIVYERLSTIRPEAERAFVCGVAARVASNARKAHQRRLRLFTQLDTSQWELLNEQSSVSEDKNPEQEAIRANGLQILGHSLAAMSEKQRAVFVLCELEQLSSREAAEALEIAETAVQSRRRKANTAFLRFCAAQPENAPHPVTSFRRRHV